MNITNPTPAHIENFSRVLDEFYLDTSYKYDKYVQNYCKKYAIWEPDLTKWMVENIKPGWVCLDMGFNIGYYSELMGRLVGKNGKIIAFEPIKELITKYRLASKYNNYDNCADINIFPYALSNKEKHEIMWMNGENVGASFITNNTHNLDELNNLYPGSKTIEIVSKTLKDMYDGPVDFIKIDIEGYEPKAWQGFSDAANECKLIVAELGPHQPMKFLTFIDKNYKIFSLNENLITIDEIVSVGLTNVVLRKK